MNKNQCPWDLKITQLILDAHRGIWEDRNKHVHGKTIDESRERARQAIIQRVRKIYDNPPHLATCYRQINEIPYEIHINQAPSKLKDWLSRIEHQIQMTKLLENTPMPGQLTIQQAF